MSGWGNSHKRPRQAEDFCQQGWRQGRRPESSKGQGEASPITTNEQGQMSTRPDAVPTKHQPIETWLFNEPPHEQAQDDRKRNT